MSKKKGKILVCMNDKPHSAIAMRFACTLANDNGSGVILLSVVDPVDYNTIFSVADVIKEDRIKASEELLKNSAQQAVEDFDIKPSIMVKEGRVSEIIVECLQDDGAINLLLLGVADDGSSNKNGVLTQMVDRIGDSFHIPVMFVPGNLTDKEINRLV